MDFIVNFTLFWIHGSLFGPEAISLNKSGTCILAANVQYLATDITSCVDNQETPAHFL